MNVVASNHAPNATPKSVIPEIDIVDCILNALNADDCDCEPIDSDDDL